MEKRNFSFETCASMNTHHSHILFFWNWNKIRAFKVDASLQVTWAVLLKSENTASPQMSPALPWWGEHRTQEWGFINFTVVWNFWHECIIILLVMSVTGQSAERLHRSMRSADLDRALSSFHSWWVWKGWMSMPGHIADQQSSREKSPEFYSIRLEFCPSSNYLLPS